MRLALLAAVQLSSPLTSHISQLTYDYKRMLITRKHCRELKQCGPLFTPSRVFPLKLRCSDMGGSSRAWHRRGHFP